MYGAVLWNSLTDRRSYSCAFVASQKSKASKSEGYEGQTESHGVHLLNQLLSIVHSDGRRHMAYPPTLKISFLEVRFSTCASRQVIGLM